MAMFGKGKQSEPADLLNADLVHELETASRKKFTGALEVTDLATKEVGSLYLFEGGLYAVALTGYLPSIPDRLRVSGTITKEQAKLLTVPGSDWPSPLAGPVAVEQQWLTADVLASLHQEYLVACLGAITALPKIKVKARKGDSTKDFCTLPLPIDPLFDTLRMRAGRLAAGWAAITAEGTPATVALESRQVAPPSDMTLPEFTALVDAVDGRTSVDSVAYGLGLTRAEAVHMSMLLVRAGVLRVATQPAVPGRGDRLLVPEAFGTLVPNGPVAVTPAPEPEPEPEPEPTPVAAEPEPEPTVSGSPLLATSAVFAADQAFGQPAVAEPVAPEPVAPEPVAPEPVAPEPVASEPVAPEPVAPAMPDSGDSSAPGWAAALLAAEAVSHAHVEDPIDESLSNVPAWGVPAAVVVESVVPEPVVPEPWAAATPTGALAMPEPEPIAAPEPEPVPAPVVAAAVASAAPVPDEHVLMLRREMASSEVAELEHLLAKTTAEETEAISRASSVRARLNSAKEAVARIDADLQRPDRP